MKIRLSTIVRIVFFAGFLGYFILDLSIDDRLTDSSTRLSRWTQEHGGRGVKAASEAFSSLGVYWLVAFFYFYILFNRNIIYMLYTITMYMIGLSITLFLKALYYRGRPFAISDSVEGCECDPGMPSGHSTMAVLTYWISYEFIRLQWLEAIVQSFKRKLAKLLVGSGCVLLGACVVLSRITLGVHTYSQIIVGLMIGTSVTIVVTYSRFHQVVQKLRNWYKCIASAYGVLVISFSVSMLFINHYLREDLGKWKYLHKCESCFNSFVKGQTDSLAMLLFLCSFWYYFRFVERPVASRRSSLICQPEQLNQNQISVLSPRLADKNSQKPLILHQNHPASASHSVNPLSKTPRPVEYSKFTAAQHSKRFLIYFLLTLPSIVVAVVYQFGLKSSLRKKYPDAVSQSMIVLIVNSTVTFSLGVAVTIIKHRFFIRFKLLGMNDSLDWNMLCKDNKTNEADVVSIQIDKKSDSQ